MHVRPKPLLCALGAGCAGFALNSFELPVFGEVSLCFGSIFSLLAARALGPWYGAVAAAIAFSNTWLNWQHPAGFSGHIGEAMVVGWLVQRHRQGLMRATFTYWLFVGTPLLLIIVSRLPAIPFPNNWALLIKYPVNGLLAALIALPIANSAQFRQALGLPRSDDSKTPLLEVLFRRFGMIATLPLMMLILLMGQKVDRTMRANADDKLRDNANELAAQIGHYVSDHERILAALAGQLATVEANPAERNARLDAALRQYPQFASLQWARETASQPQDVPPLHQYAVEADPSGSATMLLTVSAANRDNQPPARLEARLKLKPMIEALAVDRRLQQRSLWVVDSAHRVIWSSGEIHFPQFSSPRHLDLGANGELGTLSPLDWRVSESARPERHTTLSVPIPSSGWTLTLGQPEWNAARRVAGFYAATAFWGIVALGVALLIARATAHDITVSLQQITAATQSLVGDNPRAFAPPDIFPAREFTAIGTELHQAASTLSQANRQLAEAIHERDQSHRQLRQVLMHLDEKVHERTLQLEAASVAAETANNAKSGFLASMSHELRTPLNVILGMSEILREKHQGPLTERQLECVVAVEESGRHLLALINDILDLSKIEAGMLELEWQETDIRAVGDASLRLVREGAVKKSINLAASYRQSATTLMADTRRLKQILVNLLSNAVKFTPEGGSVRLEVCDGRELDTIIFAVEDTGIGIDPKHRDKLFQPFQQIDSALNRKYAGTGLGLSLVKRMTQMHGGSVEAESARHRGARFTVTLPRVGSGKSTRSRPPVELIPKSGTKAPMITGEPLILIAEDNPLNVQVYTEHLSRSKCRFCFATNGRDAIKRAQADHPDLVLMDVQMPEIDGLEAIRQLRADPQTAALPIIAVTALARPEDRIRCLEAGATSYLSKPIRLKELTTHIVEILRPKVEPEVASTASPDSP